MASPVVDESEGLRPSKRPRLSRFARQEQAKKTQRAREDSFRKFQARFQGIYSKYSKDFTGIGDIIDLSTGKIVEDNGHLRGFRNERDVGSRATNVLVQQAAAAPEAEDTSSGDELSCISPKRSTPPSTIAGLGQAVNADHSLRSPSRQVTSGGEARSSVGREPLTDAARYAPRDENSTAIGDADISPSLGDLFKSDNGDKSTSKSTIDQLGESIAKHLAKLYNPDAKHTSSLAPASAQDPHSQAHSIAARSPFPYEIQPFQNEINEEYNDAQTFNAFDFDRHAYVEANGNGQDIDRNDQDNQDERIRELLGTNMDWESQLSSDDQSSILDQNRSIWDPSTRIGRSKTVGENVRPWCAVDIENVLKWREEGLSYRVIASRLPGGRSPHAVIAKMKYVRENGFRPNKRKRSWLAANENEANENVEEMQSSSERDEPSLLENAPHSQSSNPDKHPSPSLPGVVIGKQSSAPISSNHTNGSPGESANQQSATSLSHESNELLPPKPIANHNSTVCIDPALLCNMGIPVTKLAKNGRPLGHHKVKWTPEDIQKLIRLRRDQGLTFTQVLLHFPGKTLGSVTGQMSLVNRGLYRNNQAALSAWGNSRRKSKPNANRTAAGDGEHSTEVDRKAQATTLATTGSFPTDYGEIPTGTNPLPSSRAASEIMNNDYEYAIQASGAPAPSVYVHVPSRDGCHYQYTQNPYDDTLSGWENSSENSVTFGASAVGDSSHGGLQRNDMPYWIEADLNQTDAFSRIPANQDSPRSWVRMTTTENDDHSKKRHRLKQQRSRRAHTSSGNSTGSKLAQTQNDATIDPNIMT